MATRGSKIFIGNIELTKLLAVKAFDFSVIANGLSEGNITFFVDEINMDKEGNIVIGKTKGAEFKKMSSVKWERSLIF